METRQPFAAGRGPGPSAPLGRRPGRVGTLTGYGTVLPDEWATTLFDARCGQPRTASFSLYRIYGPAAAFAGVAP